MKFTIYDNKVCLWFKFTYSQKLTISPKQYPGRIHYCFQNFHAHTD